MQTISSEQIRTAMTSGVISARDRGILMDGIDHRRPEQIGILVGSVFDLPPFGNPTTDTTILALRSWATSEQGGDLTWIRLGHRHHLGHMMTAPLAFQRVRFEEARLLPRVAALTEVTDVYRHSKLRSFVDPLKAADLSAVTRTWMGFMTDDVVDQLDWIAEGEERCRSEEAGVEPRITIYDILLRYAIETGDLEKAGGYARELASLNQRPEMPYQGRLAETLIEIGHYHAIGNVSVSIETFQRSIEIAEKFRDNHTLVGAAHLLASTLHKQGRVVEAGEWLLRYQQKYASEHVSPRLKGESAVMLSNVADLEDDVESAQLYIVEAIKHFHKAGAKAEEQVHLLAQHVLRLIIRKKTDGMIADLIQHLSGFIPKESIDTIVATLNRLHLQGDVTTCAECQANGEA